MDESMQAPFADPLSGLEGRDKSGPYKELPLVGRETEMYVIRALLDTVAFNRQTGARALTISGDIGVGKSRLLAEMYTEARARGFRVLEGRIYESGRMFPYLPFIEALRPVLHSSRPEHLRRYMGLVDDKLGPKGVKPVTPHPRADIKSPTPPTTAPAPTEDGAVIQSSSPPTTLAPTEDERKHSGPIGIKEYASPPQRADIKSPTPPATPTSDAIDEISLVGTPMVAALAGLFPELPGRLGVTISPEGRDKSYTPDQEKFRLFDGVATLLERMAMERPVLVGIDNLQWADSASLELTMYLTVRLHSSSVALVGVTRPPGMLKDPVGVGGEIVSMAASTSVARALGELMRQGLLLLLPLGPLGTEAATRHLQALLPGTFSESLAQSLLTRAEGNPFFLEELVRMLTLNGQLVLRSGTWHTTQMLGVALPDSITQAVALRLQGLSSSCRELLRVASLFGRTFPLAALVAVMEQKAVPEEQVQFLIDEAMSAAVIAKGLPLIAEDAHLSLASPTYMFCQGIVQEALSAEVPVHRARSLHGAIGAALEASYGGAAIHHAAELARHYTLSGEKKATLRWSLLAGEDAVRQQAHREAITHFRLALKLLDEGIHLASAEDDTLTILSPAQLHISIGESWFKLGELEQAAKAFQQALEQLQHGSPERVSGEAGLLLARANRLMGDVCRMQGKYELAMAHLQAAHAALEGKGTIYRSSYTGTTQKQTTRVPWFPGRGFPDSAGELNLERVSTNEHILFLQAQATLDILLNRGQEAETALWESYRLATEIGDRGSQAFALHLVGWLRSWGEQIYEAIRLQEQAHELYVAIGDPFRATLGDQGLGIIYQAIGEMERARLHNLRGLERARRYGVRFSLGWLYWNQGVLALALGEWTNSESHLHQAMQEAEATNNARLRPIVMQAEAELHFRRGNWREAEQLFRASIDAAANTEWFPSTMALYGHFLAVTGRTAAARTQLDRAASHPEPPGYGGQFYIPFLAEGYLHLGANERATTYIERIRALRGFMYYGISVDRILGVVATLAGDWETAEQAFEDGLALCRRSNNVPEEAAILYEQARATLMQSGVKTDGGRLYDLCERARELFLECGMQRAADMVDMLQEGVRIVHEEIAHSEYRLDLHLTRRELEVLRLVAEGHTDREVAETLVISHRTVNRHLSNIFVKLDVPGRAAAVAYAIRQGLVG